MYGVLQVVKLYIDVNGIETVLDESHPQHDVNASEIQSCSVTPRTFQSRKLFAQDLLAIATERQGEIISKIVVLEESKGSVKSDFEETILSLRKKAQENKVSAGDIDALDSKSKSDIENIEAKYNNKIKLLKENEKHLDMYVKFLAKNSDFVAYHDDVFEFDGVAVHRYGISTAGLTQEQSSDLSEMHSKIVKKQATEVSSDKSLSKKGKDDTGSVIRLHPMEIFLIETAIKSLSSDNRAVLVDIFAREEDGSIQSTKSGGLETHTVVLYRNNSQEFAVIDPNSSEFSKHLSGNVELLLAAGDVKILAPAKMVKIYVTPEGSDKGFAHDKYRDCIDIAAKLALMWQKMKPEAVNIQELAKDDVVKMITNNAELDKTISVTDRAIRVKQASDPRIVKLFCEIEETMAANLQVIKKSSHGLYEKVREMHESVVVSNKTHKSILEDLLVTYNESMSEFSSELLGKVSGISEDQE
jgi:hypothetical protein